MNLRKFIIAASMAMAVIACKDDDEGTISPSLDGVLRIKGLPEFVSQGQSVKLTAEGVTHPDGKEISYSWKVIPTQPTAVSGNTFNFTFSDTLQTCKIYCSASAEGYSSSAATYYATVVKGGKDGSIQGLEFSESHISTNDATYYYNQIGTDIWMMNNLAEKSSGKAYKNTEVMSDVLGRYYNYEDAMNACESLNSGGTQWTLPTLEDWQEMETFVKGTIALDSTKGKSLASAIMGDATFNTVTMWEYDPKVGDITNSSSFSVIPAGYANLQASSFDGVYDYAAFWTSTSAERASEAYCAYLYRDQPELFYGARDKASFGASVRCIRK